MLRGFSALWLLVASARAQAGARTCVEADNFLNAQYTIKAHVGTPPQELNVVADTGSFEAVFASSECTGCGNHQRFNRGESHSFRAKNPAEKITTLYGQGKVVSEAVYDRLQVGSLVAESQSLLLMQENELRDYADASYDGVMGLGVPAVARTQDPDDMSLMSGLNVSELSVCFGQRDGEKGRIELGPRPANETLEFVELPLLCEQHWGVRLDNISIGGQLVRGCENGCNAIIDSGTSLIAAPSEMLPSILEMIGDVDPSCADIDSLPTMEVTLAGHPFQLYPQMYVAKMDISDEQTAAALGMSSSAAALGMAYAQGMSATTPESVAAQQEEEDDDEEAANDAEEEIAAADPGAGRVRKASAVAGEETPDPLQGFRRRLASLQAGRTASPSRSTNSSSVSKEQTPASSHEQCVALFMDMDMVTSLPGRPFILGIPWLRAFVTKFNRDRRTIGLAQVPVGSSYCASCGATSLAASETHGASLASQSLGVSSLSSGFGAAPATLAPSEERHVSSRRSKGSEQGNALLPANAEGEPTHAEERAAKLESVAPAHVGTQVLTERTVLLSKHDASTHKSSTQLHAQRAKPAFRFPYMKLRELRLPMWVQKAHGEWHKSNRARVHS